MENFSLNDILMYFNVYGDLICNDLHCRAYLTVRSFLGVT